MLALLGTLLGGLVLAGMLAAAIYGDKLSLWWQLRKLEKDQKSGKRNDPPTVG